MVSYLDLGNEARGEYGYAPLSLIAVQLNRGDSLQLVQAVNRTFADFIEYSVDFDFNEIVNDVTLTIGNQVVTQADWDPQVINWIKYVKGDGTLPELTRLSGIERAVELEAALTDEGEPLFFYVNQGIVKVIPEPDQAYVLKIGYQGAYNRITSSLMGSTVVFPSSFYNAFVHGVKARWRMALGDVKADSLEAQFYKKMDLVVKRNKFGVKNTGLKKFRMKIRTGDRTL